VEKAMKRRHENDKEVILESMKEKQERRRVKHEVESVVK